MQIGVFFLNALQNASSQYMLKEKIQCYRLSPCLYKCNYIFYSNKSCQSLSKSTENMDAYQWVTDDVLQQIRRIDSTGVKASRDIINRIYRRDLYKLIGEKRVKWVKESEKVLVN